MGLEGISSSFVIVFDTNQNPSNLTPEYHISFHKDVKKDELCSQHVDFPDIDDDSNHKVESIWDPSSELMAVFFDNESSTPTLQMGVHLSNTFKSGETFWGSTAGTGAKSNEQTVCIKEVKIGSGTFPLLHPNNILDCGVQMQEFKFLGSVTASTVNDPIVLRIVFVIQILVGLVVLFIPSLMLLVK